MLMSSFFRVRVRVVFKAESDSLSPSRDEFQLLRADGTSSLGLTTG